MPCDHYCYYRPGIGDFSSTVRGTLPIAWSTGCRLRHGSSSATSLTRDRGSVRCPPTGLSLRRTGPVFSPAGWKSSRKRASAHAHSSYIYNPGGQRENRQLTGSAHHGTTTTTTTDSDLKIEKPELDETHRWRHVPVRNENAREFGSSVRARSSRSLRAGRQQRRVMQSGEGRVEYKFNYKFLRVSFGSSLLLDAFTYRI